MENEKVINKKSFSRFFATQILFSYFFDKDENDNKSIADLTSFLEEYYISEEFSDTDTEEYKKNINVIFLNELLTGTLKNINEIDALLNERLTGKYTFNSIDDLIKVILRLAMYEFLYTDIEKKIVINEYVDIAGEYLDEKATSFVNATLDNLSKIEKNNITSNE